MSTMPFVNLANPQFCSNRWTPSNHDVGPVAITIPAEDTSDSMSGGNWWTSSMITSRLPDPDDNRAESAEASTTSNGQSSEFSGELGEPATPMTSHSRCIARDPIDRAAVLRPERRPPATNIAPPVEAASTQKGPPSCPSTPSSSGALDREGISARKGAIVDNRVGQSTSRICTGGRHG